MIVVNWVYKGTVVSFDKVDMEYTTNNLNLIRKKINNKELKSPANYERYVISSKELKELYVG